MTDKKHVNVMLLFRVRFTYTVDNVPFSRVALVKATSPIRAKDYIVKWLQSNGVVLANFQFKSITRCTEYSYIIDPDLFRSSSDLPDPDEIQSSLRSDQTLEEFLDSLGDFSNEDLPSFF